MNTLGTRFRITSVGESHGTGIGIVVDGCPAGLPLHERDIQEAVDQRKPIVAAISTSRHEPDQVQIWSGVTNGFTTGAPILLLVGNRDVESQAYEQTRLLPRPGHADYTSFIKYGGWGDHRGGGRFSGRITVGLVMAGAIAKKLLTRLRIEVLAHTVQIGAVKAPTYEEYCRQSPPSPSGRSSMPPDSPIDWQQAVYASPVRCVSAAVAEQMIQAITQAREQQDSVGGMVEAVALHVPAGLGEPIFDTVEGEIAKAMFAIPAVKGVEFGAGFAVAAKKGSDNNDPFVIVNGRIATATNHAGGILGGISTGMPIVVRVAIKPTPSIGKQQKTVDLSQNQPALLTLQGRHDPCIVPRTVIVVEAMLAIVLCDLALRAGLLAATIA